MAELEHILLTRFGVYCPDRGRPTDTWLNDQLDLFERYTLVSVRSQTQQPDPERARRTYMLAC
jgi:hypothetical protein